MNEHLAHGLLVPLNDLNPMRVRVRAMVRATVRVGIRVKIRVKIP